ncbi:MAG TPA: hypothetical protein VNN25_20135 [Thermoanaerobaculia bacterium]|nr:hypothetical protein [Thermoanaerobaculia bacterium]
MAKESRWPLMAAIAVLIVHGCVVFRSGVSLPPDSVAFSLRADLLIANHFNFPAASRATGVHNVPAGMYMLFTTLVALAKLVAGARWPTILVVANLCFDALTAAILVKLVRLATRSNAAAVLAIVVWLLCYDVVTWVRMPLTDVPFLVVSFAAFASVVAPYLAGEKPTRKNIIASVILTVISVLLRPVGFLWLILMVTASLVMSGRLRRRSLIASALLVAATVFLAHTFVVRNPESWTIETLARSVRWDAKSYRLGEVIKGRPETFHAPPSTAVDYAAITADRFVHFFAPMVATFSRGHKIAGVVFYAPLYLLAIAAVIAAARRKGTTADVVILSAVVVLTVAFWHSLVVIDYDWRYRLPILPHLVFLAACAVPMLLRNRAIAE